MVFTCYFAIVFKCVCFLFLVNFFLNILLFYCRTVIAFFLLLSAVTADGYEKRVSAEVPSLNQTGLMIG